MAKVKLTIPLEDTFPSGEKVYRTAMAYGVIINGQKIYLPKSQMHKDDIEITDTTFSCWIEQWLVEKNGLDMFIDTSDTPTLF